MYVGSETSRVEVTIYPNHPSEFGVVQKTLRFNSTPVKEPDSTTMHVVAVQTMKRLGEAAGRFEVQLKGSVDLRKTVQDGDWIDIVFTRHASKYHVMRGIILTVVQSVTATSGPTVATYTLIGEDFGYIFNVQRFWFDQVTQDQYFPWLADRVTRTGDALRNGRPDFVVGTLLHGLLLPGNNRGAGLWELPKDMIVGARLSIEADPSHLSFHQVYRFVNGYSNVPNRTSLIIPERFSASGDTAWAVAAEFADAELCEFFTDLIQEGAPVSPDPGTPTAGATSPGNVYLSGTSVPETTAMAVIFRDHPFPNSVRDGKDFLAAPYFSLPIVEVAPQEVSSTELAIHGELRKNTFFFGPSILADQVGPYHTLQLPIIDLESIKHHGTRRHDAESRYSSETSSATTSKLPENEKLKIFATMAYQFRDIVRDLHCMDHLLFNGTISLNRSEPAIRIGTRFRIRGQSPETNFTAYVEEVSHNWSFDSGSRTNITVTHGWEGTDQSYVDKLRERISKFAELQIANEAPSTTTPEKDFDRVGRYFDQYMESFSKAAVASAGRDVPKESDAAGAKQGASSTAPSTGVPSEGDRILNSASQEAERIFEQRPHLGTIY